MAWDSAGLAFAVKDAHSREATLLCRDRGS
jgi:hypothetical protein